MRHTQESAEILGLKALAWLAGNEELLPVFLGATGASEADIKAGASEPVFLGSVLDFLMLDDAWVVECCEALEVPNEALMSARQALPGGDQVHWT